MTAAVNSLPSDLVLAQMVSVNPSLSDLSHKMDMQTMSATGCADTGVELCLPSAADKREAAVATAAKARRRKAPIADIDKTFVIYESPHYDPTASYVELRKFAKDEGCISRRLRFTVKDGAIRLSCYSAILSFAGRKVFRKQVEEGWFYYKKGKFYGQPMCALLQGRLATIRNEVYDHLGIGWLKELPTEGDFASYAFRPLIFKSVLTGSIYNQETLTKAIGKRLFHLQDFSWKLLRSYLRLEVYERASLYNLQDFTTNLNVSMQRFLQAESDQRRLYCDIIKMAADEDVLVNLAWSDKRLTAEHTRQILRAEKSELEAKEQTPIYTKEQVQTLETDTIRLLNTEMDVFLEGEMMHHCVYHCYWNSIRSHRYFALHMTAPEDCTIGVMPRFDRGKMTVDTDQVYLSYDRPVSSQTRTIVERYVKEHAEAFLALCNHSDITGETLHYFDEADLPF